MINGLQYLDDKGKAFMNPQIIFHIVNAEDFMFMHKKNEQTFKVWVLSLINDNHGVQSVEAEDLMAGGGHDHQDGGLAEDQSSETTAPNEEEQSAEDEQPRSSSGSPGDDFEY